MLRSKRMLGLLGLLLFFGCGPLGPASTAALLLSGSSSKKDSKTTDAAFRITTKSLPEGEVDVAYPATTLSATGGTPPYTWSDVNDTLQTYGLSLNSATGEITGTPTQATPAGGVTVTISVTDTNSDTAQKDFTLIIYPELQIDTTTLPDAYDGQTGYSATLSASGGKGGGSYTWSIVSASGTLPPDLSLDSSGLISGDVDSNASQGGTGGVYNFTVEVTDGIGTKQADLSIKVWEKLQITTTSLDDAVEGEAYSYTVQGQGGDAANYNWSVSGQPSWLSIDSSTGELSGTPPAGSAGTYTFTVTVDDALQTVSKQFDLTVKSAGSLTITTTSLPDATEGASYSATIEASGGATPYTWTVSGLPSGLTWSQVGDTVEISGTPDAGTAGTYNIDVTVSDSSSPAQSDNTTLQLVVNSAGGGTTVKADFEASPTQGKAPLEVNFTDKSTPAGSVVSWQWDFGDGGTSTEQNPTHQYNDPGWYTVKLTVSDGTSSDTCVKKMYVLVANNIWYVDGEVTSSGNGTSWEEAFKTIEEGINAAGGYDLVLVADATYNETGSDFGGKKIYLKGVDRHTPGACPVIDCQQAGRAFYFGSAETKDSVIDNFIIRNGKVEDTYGGGVLCENDSSPTIRNCVFQNNKAEDTNSLWENENGGAIYCDHSSPSITNCTFSGNSAYFGGAIYCYHSSSSITCCRFSANRANNQGGAIRCYFSSPNITNCTFSNNSAGQNGGAIGCYYYGSPTLNNCILWGNSAGSEGDEIHIRDLTSSCTLNYCCVDNTGYGGETGKIDDSNNCIFSDPQFVDAAGGDYHLRDTSPCIDAGDNSYVPAGVTTDLDGKPRIVDGDDPPDGVATVDIGAYEYQP